MDFLGSDPGFVSRITSRPGFVNPVQSGPGFNNPVRSDSIRSDPGFVNARTKCLRVGALGVNSMGVEEQRK